MQVLTGQILANFRCVQKRDDENAGAYVETRYDVMTIPKVYSIEISTPWGLRFAPDTAKINK